eukprot:CAMPEP_0179624186 /NCGR_PEP_ID=MMETSP0932-20121108/2640_1 /TAXON_ID=548131 ORGANISM="Ostreococcus mediterraneus, Strain clade-D-RCC2596" /NCGR_SAMPLE_ID=MMETSP0932 /ASSEMBLY_ACC=CAM_ASM_000582 /LENGTH=188 /DNA_ID=CAMNT_0021493383 /DNA_START=130 /DNA_END=697 /DNA_ORIENTATION=+
MPHRAHPYGADGEPDTLQNLRGALDVDAVAAAVRYVGISFGTRSTKLCSSNELNVLAATARLFSATPRVVRFAFFAPFTICASPSRAFSLKTNSSSSLSTPSLAPLPAPGTMATSDSKESNAATSARVVASTTRNAFEIFLARPLFRAPSPAPPACATAVVSCARGMVPYRDDATAGVTSWTNAMMCS